MTIRLSIQVTSAGLLVTDKRALKRLMRQAGAEVVGLARAKVRRKGGGGRTYRGSGGSRYRPYIQGRYQASGPDEAPVSVTGTLAKSIVARPFPSGEGVAIRARAFYALFLEAGAKGGGRKGARGGKGGKARNATVRVLTARPFLTTALEQREGSLGQRIRDAVVDGIEFRRVTVAQMKKGA